MHIIGILGGVAGGKSLVARLLADLGVVVLDADRAGHEVLRLPQVEAAARERWGKGVFGPDGRIDRERLAMVVFANPPAGSREREYLERLTHQEIAKLLKEQSDTAADSGAAVAVLDAPLILEAGWDKLCKVLIFVDTPRTVRLSRAVGRGWSEKDFAAREDAQESLDRKRERADVIIDNSGTPEHTRAQIEQFWQSQFS